MTPYLDAGALRRALSLRDLTDPARGPHAMQRLLDELLSALPGERRVHREPPLVSVEDNYDRLGYPADGAARDARHTRWVSERVLLRTQTSAMVPRLLDGLAREPGWTDVLLVCPGLVYRRDVIDRLHVGEPHQLDLWRLRRGPPLDGADLRALVTRVAGAALPGREVRTAPAAHPYTRDGLQVDVLDGGVWVEVGECGLAAPDLLRRAGLAGDVTGLAMGLGLDRLLLLRKGIPDIRLLRSDDPRAAAQLQDLAPWRPLAATAAARRDLSLAVEEGATAEELGDRVRVALGRDAESVEEVALLSETPRDALPAAARARLGLAPGQKNVLLRVVLRAADRDLSRAEANGLRDRVWAALHAGARQRGGGP